MFPFESIRYIRVLGNALLYYYDYYNIIEWNDTIKIQRNIHFFRAIFNQKKTKQKNKRHFLSSRLVTAILGLFSKVQTILRQNRLRLHRICTRKYISHLKCHASWAT